MTLLERYAADLDFRAFVDAQRGHDAVELAALKVEFSRQSDVIQAQYVRIKDLENESGQTRRSKAKV